MPEIAKTCTYTVDGDDWEEWGGDLEGWHEVLDGLRIEDDIWECPHEVVETEENGKNRRCIFHSNPDEIPVGMDEAEQLRQAINESTKSDDEDVRRLNQFLGAKFGHLNLDGLTLKSSIDNPLMFSGATFTDKVELHYATFGGVANFRLATFKDKANFEGATFSFAGFSDATFEDEARFRDASFENVAHFPDTTFKIGGIFANVSFEDVASFRNATFKEENETRFAGAVFNNEAGFRFASFEDKANFLGVDFENVADFRDTTFDSVADFRDTTFEDVGDFRDASFEEKATFVTAIFNGRARFRDITFKKKAVFREAGLSDAILEGVNLSKADFRKADLTDATLTGSDLCGINAERAVFTRTDLFDVDIRGARLYGAVIEGAQINDSTGFGERCVYDPHFLSDRSPFLEDRIVSVFSPQNSHSNQPPDGNEGNKTLEDPKRLKDRSNLQKAAGTYRTIEVLARANALGELQTSAFINRQDMQLKDHKKNGRLGRRITARASRLVVLYGESPWRVIATAIFLIITTAILYPFGGLVGSDSVLVSYFHADGSLKAFNELLSVFADSLYFSTLTFTTLGFGDFTPTRWGRLLATGQTAAGVVLLALLVFVFGRRATR